MGFPRRKAGLQPRPERTVPIIFSESFRSIVKGQPLVYVDAGARGGLEGPWGEIHDDRLHVVAFEPDPEGAKALARKPNVDVVESALWSERGTVDVHLAKIPSTSSVHPPNWPLLKRFPPQHAEPRTTLKVSEVLCDTLDASLARLGKRADFLKIDTQGSEFEILSGAEKALEDSIFGVVAESWTIEVHKGQRMTGEILSFMNQRGFALFDLSVGAAWYRRGAERLLARNKRQIVGLDLLFFREPTAVPARFADAATAARAAAIAELYGFPDLALEILDLSVPNGPSQAADMSALRNALVNGGNAEFAAKLHY
jgi:FkbM family methyltransferase